MRPKNRMWLASLAVLCLSANAQGRIDGPSPSSRASWDLFSEPGAAAAVRQVAVSELPLPLVVRESKASHHRIEVDGQSFWIKGSQVRMVRGSTAGCVPGGKGQILTASTPGAVKDGC
jgi:hypothetical protein